MSMSMWELRLGVVKTRILNTSHVSHLVNILTAHGTVNDHMPYGKQLGIEIYQFSSILFFKNG